MHGLAATLLTVALVAIPRSAARPTSRQWKHKPFRLAAELGATRCDTSAFHLPAYENISAILPPSTATLTAVTLGVGTQNYTCQNSSWVNIGAVAELFDISCLAPNGTLARDLPQLALAVYGDALFGDLETDGFKIADHYFDNSTGPNLPVFNFRASNGSYVIAQETAQVAPPDLSGLDVDWVLLTAVDGSAASFVVQEETYRGQPLAPSCSISDSSMVVRYAAKYWFFE